MRYNYRIEEGKRKDSAGNRQHYEDELSEEEKEEHLF
jgi:hypothetical protein